MGCADAILDSLPSVMWFIRRNMRRHRSAGLSVPQFRTLGLLHRFPCLPLSAVAENLGSTLPTASRIISGLVQKGLVDRHDSSGDRRKLSLTLTLKGKTTLVTARQGTQEQVAEVVKTLSEAERKNVVVAMDKLKSLFSAPAYCPFDEVKAVDRAETSEKRKSSTKRKRKK